jgi:hypothetical protein
MSVKKTHAELSLAVARSARDNDGWPSEANETINNASRAVVLAMFADHGAAWLGKINRARDERSGAPVWAWDGGLVYNFAADFVVPAFDAELARLILEREAAVYTSVADDAPRVYAILERVKAIGGLLLFWT